MLRVSGLCTVCLLMISVCPLTGRVDQLEVLPEDLQHMFDVYRTMLTLDQHPGQIIYWSSLQHYICKFVQSRPEMTPKQSSFFNEKIKLFMQPIYNHNSNASRAKRQAAGPRIRREIRDMSISQRRRYFNAVNALKNDQRLSPNIYDVLVAFHQGNLIARAHFGPAFPAWHRLYLWLYESFLRLHDPTVTVPYWASLLDNEMEDATLSVIWSDGFFGNGAGEIRSGPFRNWRSINPATVFTRNVGSGPLYSYANVEAILNKSRNWQILVPTAEPDSNFEFLHGGPHVFVSGSMNRLDEAVRDPIFYSHHSFVDYIWEQFRLRQRLNGINPETDYPFNASDPRFSATHSPTAMMGFFPGNELSIDYQNRVGYLNVFFDLVEYTPVPTCPSCGGSRYLFCNRTMTIPRCVSRSRRGARGRTFRNDLFADELTTPTAPRKRRTVPSTSDTCPRQPFMSKIDSSRTPSGNHLAWVYIPVSIIQKRPPTYSHFKDYSLYSYGVSSQEHVRNSKTQFIQPGTQQGYEKCAKLEDSVGKIKILTYGINYDGVTEENAIVDNRLGLSQSYGYALVKAPRPGMPSDAIVGAFDSCGRVCRPYCLKGTTSMSRSTGGIRVNTEFPLQYGHSYADATLASWKIAKDSGSPITDGSQIPLTFYCDYADDWIWTRQVDSRTNQHMGRNVQPTPATESGAPSAGRHPPLTDRTPHMEARQTPRNLNANAYIGRTQSGCVMTNSYCRLRVACSPCQHMEERQCIGSRHNAVCVNGVFELQDVYVGRGG